MSMRRGACPSLLQPMRTGDGLLARFSPAHGRLTPPRLKDIGMAAERFGNGLVEITSRGKLQIRGLTEERTPLLAARMAGLDLDISEGFQVETGALSGLSADAILDPEPLAALIMRRVGEAGFIGKLGPKVSVTVDGGGPLHLAEIGADLKIEATCDGQWRLGIGGNGATARWLGAGDAGSVADVCLAVLSVLAEEGPLARARQLTDEALGEFAAPLHAAAAPARDHPSPVGTFALSDGSLAHGFALAFGQARGAELASFAGAAESAREIRLAPGGGLLVLGLAQDCYPVLRGAAERLGFICDPEDPRLAIVACAGAPSCAAAHFNAKAVARDVAASGLFDGAFRLHLSACPKLCAAPAGGRVTLIGQETSCSLSTDGAAPAGDLLSLLTARGETHRTVPCRKKC
ncbi:precorrin-3B synthase [Nitratireductor sp. ZSWI3]|uniref:precorrin-3B synthase n=1 Tax=Nitratireductor sp. ZSWI3 TaxID=2966359 RepID=UPI00214FD3E8|nr:precorrin-3B synthase [Nitratireductor sp. ZSWI3]MCR4269418.1 precorrin-3B synthase [Nitratireductor sp. ZSWI3]